MQFLGQGQGERDKVSCFGTFSSQFRCLPGLSQHLFCETLEPRVGLKHPIVLLDLAPQVLHLG
eukprot:1947091-Alexandrium_andersonii.AAC.1